DGRPRPLRAFQFKGEDMLREIPLPQVVTAEDVRFAVRTVVVHIGERWPAGTSCRNCHAPFPCRTSWWGRRVLAAWGLSESEIDALVVGGDPHVVVPQHAPIPSQPSRPT
ncbi:MAG TPA: hypothetical protein VFX60_11605, partial [Micromonospora sp.]|nr:hypothetical protein [Micromonospora sp.]